jgi:hypothetical protein
VLPLDGLPLARPGPPATDAAQTAGRPFPRRPPGGTSRRESGVDAGRSPPMCGAGAGAPFRERETSTGLVSRSGTVRDLSRDRGRWARNTEFRPGVWKQKTPTLGYLDCTQGRTQFNSDAWAERQGTSSRSCTCRPPFSLTESGEVFGFEYLSGILVYGSSGGAAAGPSGCCCAFIRRS